MTNEQKIREEISTTEGLAEYLIVYSDEYGCYYANDGSRYYIYEDALNYEIDWLRQEYEKNS